MLVEFIQEQFLFYISIISTLFIPGYFLSLAIFGKNFFSVWEKIAVWFGFSFVLTSIFIIIIGSLYLPINALTVLGLITIFSLINFAIYKKRFGSNETKRSNEFNFSKNQKILILLLLSLTILIKTTYLTNTIFPTSTDLGHHMYWSKLISETGELPTYQEQDIVLQENGSYAISQPKKIADFIIGEHLIFSAINIISGISFISYFPSLVLFLVNLISILALFIFAYRLFEKHPQRNKISIFTLLLIGPLYALASPQAKFISGGVIGNMLGNLLIPLVLYFLYRALKEKNSWFIFSTILLTAGMFYTHHLSSFIFIYVFIFTLLFFLIFNFKEIKEYLKDWMQILLRPQIIILILSFLLFALFIYTPNYIETSAVDTAVGGPSKETRAGLNLTELKFSSGEARSIMALIGFIIILLGRKFKDYRIAFILGWTISIFLMSTKPSWLYLDIPSSRIANYIVYPLSLMGAIGISGIVSKMKVIAPKKITLLFLIILFTYIFSNGFQDNSYSLSTNSDPEKALQTFHASKYLKNNSADHDIILKDHNYLTSDTWIRLFFMKDYNYPFSRSYFKRYDDPVKKREMCTLWMMSTPNSTQGEKCFSDLGVNLLIVNPQFDGPQFDSSNFWKIYENNSTAIYYRINE